MPAGSRLRVAGNLPYNVASPILFALVGLHAAGLPLADATVMLQREVADRLVAPPGGRDYGVLTVLIGHRAAAERMLEAAAGRVPPAAEGAVGARPADVPSAVAGRPRRGAASTRS